MALAISSAVAEELGQELEVGRLAAAGAGPGVLEERLQELRALDVEPRRRARAVELGEVEEERRSSPAPASRSGALRRHVDGLVPRVRLVLGRADLDAEVAAGAVLGRHLDRVLPALERRRPGSRSALKVAGAPARALGVVDLGADGGVRADERALVALDADLRVPDRDLDGEVALLPLRGAHRPGAVHREGAHGQEVALAGHHHRGHALHEVGRVRRRRGAAAARVAVAAVGGGTSWRWARVCVHRREVALAPPRRRACRRSSRSPS